MSQTHSHTRKLAALALLALSGCDEIAMDSVCHDDQRRAQAVERCLATPKCSVTASELEVLAGWKRACNWRHKSDEEVAK